MPFCLKYMKVRFGGVRLVRDINACPEPSLDKLLYLQSSTWYSGGTDRSADVGVSKLDVGPIMHVWVA